MGRFLNDMQIADLRCIQVNKGGMKYELMLSFQSTLDSNQVKSKCPNRTASMCDLDRNKEAMEIRSSESKVKLMRPRTSCGVDVKKKVVRNSKALEMKNTKSVAPNDKIFTMATQMTHVLENLSENLRSVEEQLKSQETLIYKMRLLTDNLADSLRNTNGTRV
ncbi:hypothetical protein TNCT_136331 [Trichonephila clavata]|uniref:Uncharacterized protein n=1 Tax=Trichonephila clavata TaxID=2740835 RepID=A0A8X6GKC7_TRICU|nr:hypothetical protein TNCT_136331 [Trichonephila clavata]